MWLLNKQKHITDWAVSLVQLDVLFWTASTATYSHAPQTFFWNTFEGLINERGNKKIEIGDPKQHILRYYVLSAQKSTVRL